MPALSNPTSIDEMRQNRLGLPPAAGSIADRAEYSIKITEICNSKSSADVRNRAHVSKDLDLGADKNLKVQIQRTPRDKQHANTTPARVCFHAKKSPCSDGCKLDCILKYSDPPQAISHWTFTDKNQRSRLGKLLKHLGAASDRACVLSLDFARGIITFTCSPDEEMISGEQVGAIALPSECVDCNAPRKYVLESEKAVFERSIPLLAL